MLIPQQRQERIDWLDALRGWAVLGVVCVHTGPVAHIRGIASSVSSAGQYGVQLFFLVSALTISRTYESHIARSGKHLRSQAAWLLKRLFRIAPLYYLAAVFYPLEEYAILRASHGRYGGITHLANVAANFLFLHTWIPSANNSVVPGGWSIGVEMFFYLLVPLIWLAESRWMRVSILIAGSVAGLTVTLLTSRLLTGSTYVTNDTYLYYWFPSQAPVIAIGLILYCLAGKRLWTESRDRWSWVYFAGFLACLPPALILGTSGELAPVFASTVFGCGFAFLVLSLRGSLHKVVVNPVAVALGRISFSVYILHFFVLDCIRTFMQVAHVDRTGGWAFPIVLAVALILTSGIAIVTKRLVEDPGNRFGHRMSALLVANHAAGIEPGWSASAAGGLRDRGTVEAGGNR